MKNKIIKVVSIMSVLAVLSSLFACSRATINADDKIIYVSIVCTHMCFDECYDISVCLDNGEALLNGECFVDEELTHLEKIKISDDEFNTLNKLCNTLDCSLLKKKRERNVRVFVADETIYEFYVKWENGNTVNRSYIPDGTGSEIKDYLFSLMKKYK